MSDALEAAPVFQGSEGIKILSRAGDGRRSQWYQAEQVRLDRIIALKALRPVLAESPKFREFFFAAGRQAATMVHPAALPIINIFPKQNCLAVHWCGDSSLREWIGRTDAVKITRVGEVVMDCLASLHATERAHGSLTPGNIFLGDDDTVMLDDFFQPPVMSDGEREYKGDTRYIAREYAATEISDWRGDVFSLGVILLECLNRENAPEELVQFLTGLTSPDPLDRGVTPDLILAGFKRMRRLAEGRLGRSVTIRRKRMYRRVPGEFDVSLRKRSATPEETATILMKIRNVGESGVFVETDDDLLVIGSILELDFGLKGVDGNVHAFGVVRWKSAPPMPRGVGVQFLEVDQAGLMRLRKFLEGRESEAETD